MITLVGYIIGLKKVSAHFILVWRLVSVICIASMNKHLLEERRFRKGKGKGMSNT